MSLIIASNPFNPSRDKRTAELLPEQTLELALREHGIDTKRVVLSLNGEIIPPERGLSLVPKKTDCITVVPLLEDKTLQILASVGVAALATFVSGGIASPLLAAVVGAAISVGGALLIAGIASLFAKHDSGEAYTWAGPQTSARSGLPIPKGFGKMRCGGNVVMSWVDTQGTDTDTPDGTVATIGRQWINILICFGHGPARSISDIRINNNDITTYTDVCYFTMLGTQDQTMPGSDPTPWTQLNLTTVGAAVNTAPTVSFQQVSNNYPISQRVQCGRPQNYVIVAGQRSDTTQLDVAVQFPQGVWRVTSDGNKVGLFIYYNVYYKLRTDTAWVLAKEHHYFNSRQVILRQVTTITDLPAGCYDVMVEKIKSVWDDGAGYYNYEAERDDVGDEVWIESVQETFFETHNYPNMIMLGLRIMATDQLSGNGIDVSALVEFGCTQTRPAELASLAENSPPVVAYDILTDPIVGGGSLPANIDLDMFAPWGELCLTPMSDGDGGVLPLAEFNGIFDKDGITVWDAFQTVCVLARANPLRIGTQVSVALDVPETPVQMFHVGNIYKDSYSKTYLNIDDRAQQVEVDFADSYDDYKTRTPEVVIPTEDQGSGLTLKYTRINLLGCTNRAQAYYWAYHKLLQNKLLLRAHMWDSPAQAIVSRVGNVVWLQHDIPQWANGGLIVGGEDTSHVVLDRDDYPFVSGTTFTLIVLHPVLLRYASVAVTSISGTTINVSGFDGLKNVKRAVLGDVDIAINDFSPGVLELASFDSSFIVGSVLKLYDTDVMEESVVSALDGAVATLTTPLSAIPTLDAGYIYQSTTKAPIKVKLTGMKRTGDQKFTLTAVDYNPCVFYMPAPTSIGEKNPLQPTMPIYWPTSFLDRTLGDIVGGSEATTDPSAPYSMNPARAAIIAAASVNSCGLTLEGWSAVLLAGISIFIDYEIPVYGGSAQVVIMVSFDARATWTVIHTAVSTQGRSTLVVPVTGVQDISQVAVNAYVYSPGGGDSGQIKWHGCWIQ